MGDRTYLRMQIHPKDLETDAWAKWLDAKGEGDEDGPNVWADSEADYGMTRDRDWLANEGVRFVGHHDAGGDYSACLFYSDGDLCHEWPCDHDLNPSVEYEDGRVNAENARKLDEFMLAHHRAECVIREALLDGLLNEKAETDEPAFNAVRYPIAHIALCDPLNPGFGYQLTVSNGLNGETLLNTTMHPDKAIDGNGCLSFAEAVDLLPRYLGQPKGAEKFVQDTVRQSGAEE